MPRKWTDEQRQELSVKNRHHRPWEKSTGPKTEAGKERAAANACKHGNYTKNAYEVRAALRAQSAMLDHIEAIIKLSKYAD